MNLISINNEDYISLNDAENYLDEPSAIFRVEVGFFKYKGFAEMRGYPDQIMRDTSETDPDMVEWIDVTPSEEVYVDGMAEIVIQPLIQAYYDAADVYISEFQEFIGLVNGKQSNVSYFENGKAIHIRQQLLNLYSNDNYNDDILVKVSDLDALAEKYGIPKKSHQEIIEGPTAKSTQNSVDEKPVSVKIEASTSYKKSQKPDDDYYAIVFHIEKWEKEKGGTPTFNELWEVLIQADLSLWDINYLTKDRSRIKKRYQTLYPAIAADR